MAENIINPLLRLGITVYSSDMDNSVFVRICCEFRIGYMCYCILKALIPMPHAARNTCWLRSIYTTQ